MSGITFSEATGLNDSIFGKSQAPVRLFLETKSQEYDKQSALKKLFLTENSSHYAEKLTALTAMDGFRPVGENGALPIDSQREGYSKTLEHMTWKDSFAVSREMVEDSNLIDFRRKPQAFIRGYYRTRERFGAALYGAAIQGKADAKFDGMSFSAAAADGENLFSTAHPSILGGKSQCNVFTDTFSGDALGKMETVMQNFTGDNGEILDIAPDTILIPNIHSLKKAVFAAVGSALDPDSDGNGANYQYGRWNIVVWNYLNQYVDEGSAPWILLDSRYNQEAGGAVWLDRTPLDVESYVDRNTGANVWSGYSRFIAGFNDWRFACVGGVAEGSTL